MKDNCRTPALALLAPKTTKLEGQAEGTRGRKCLEGAQRSKTKGGYPVEAKIFRRQIANTIS
jgi:hypothetical protein